MITAALCAAFCAGAMPTKEALEAARPKVMLKTKNIVRKLNSGALKPGEAADAFAALTVRPTGEAEKFLLLNAALRLRMRSGDIAGAKAVVDRLKAEIPGITAEQLNALMLEETPNCYAAWFSDDKSTPSARNSTRSATSRAKFISWVTMIMPMLRFASIRITASTSPTIAGSRALVGSSNNSTLGSIIRQRHIAMRCCCPPERTVGQA